VAELSATACTRHTAFWRMPAAMGRGGPPRSYKTAPPSLASLTEEAITPSITLANALVLPWFER
jgi:hypothetical protein